jgi:hypothetical protein
LKNATAGGATVNLPQPRRRAQTGNGDSGDGNNDCPEVRPVGILRFAEIGYRRGFSLDSDFAAINNPSAASLSAFVTFLL